MSQDWQDWWQQKPFKNRVLFLSGSKDTYMKILDAARQSRALVSIEDDLRSENTPPDDPQWRALDSLRDRIGLQFTAALKETFDQLVYPSVNSSLRAGSIDLAFAGNTNGEATIKQTLKTVRKFTSEISDDAFRTFPSGELLGWFEGKTRWRYVMRLRADTWIHGTAAPMGCEVRRLRLPRGHCRGFRDVQLWESGHRANVVLARPVGITAAEPWYLVSNLDPNLDLVWAYGQRFCCEQLFRDQKSGIFQLERSGLRDPARLDRLLLVVAIAVLISALQGYAVSLAGERHRVDPHWKRGLSFARIGLHWIQQSVIASGRILLAWMPIPLQELEPCIPSRGVRRRQKRPWFARIELPPPSHSTAPMAIA